MMIKIRGKISILMAEDDPDDRLLLKEALEGIQTIKSLEFVENGEELMNYLRHRGVYTYLPKASHPCLIILDLNMPIKDGREVLKEIKNDSELRKIPIVVLTTSKNPEDITCTYELGVNSYISKPVTFEEWTKIIGTLIQYWAEIVELPVPRDGERHEPSNN